MHDKTQVIPLTSGDYVHTRLTHSLEVVNIANSIGVSICRSDSFARVFPGTDACRLEQKLVPILNSAALLHDVGNPPFGHFGETAIQNFFKYGEGQNYLKGLDNNRRYDFIEFDGNAQGFRVITKLQYLDDLYGLNLTCATLGAYIKYPNYGRAGATKYIGTKKHGVMYSEKEYLDTIIKKCQLKVGDSVKRHPLSFIVEAADSICYSIMDIEDAIGMKWLSFEDMLKELSGIVSEKIEEERLLAQKESREYVIDEMRYKDENGNSDVRKLIGYCEKDAAGKEIIRSERKRIVDFRVSIVNYLVELATNNFIKNLGDIDAGSYSKELIEEDPYCLAKALKDFCYKRIFTHREIRALELTGDAVLSGLFSRVLACLFNKDKEYRKRIASVIADSRLRVIDHEVRSCVMGDKGLVPDENLTDYAIDELDAYYKLKLAVDWISGMTDKYAVEMYQRLCGNLI